MTPQAKRFWNLATVVFTVPASLGVELLARKLLFQGSSADELRAMLGPPLTRVSWITVWITLGGVPLGWLLYRPLLRQTLERIRGQLRRELTDDERWKADGDALLLATTVPQVPPLVATLLTLLGADLEPMLYGLVLSSAGVLAIGLVRIPWPEGQAPSAHPPGERATCEDRDAPR